MSLFYVASSRQDLGNRCAEMVQSLFPGLEARYPNPQQELLDTLVELAEKFPDVFVVFTEDLGIQEDLAQSLHEVFGAEKGDTIVELANPEGEPQIWQMEVPAEDEEEPEVLAA